MRLKLKQNTSLAIPFIFPFIEAPKLLLSFRLPKLDLIVAAKNLNVCSLAYDYVLSKVLKISHTIPI